MSKCEICGLEKPHVFTSGSSGLKFCSACLQRFICSGKFNEPAPLDYAPSEPGASSDVEQSPEGVRL